MASKPTIVLIPGACLSTTIFSSFFPYLQKLGYPIRALQLASADPPGDPYLASAASDAGALREQIVPILDTGGGTDIVVVLHSYAGIPGGGSVKGLSKEVRAKEGKEGGVVGVIWLAALLLPEGKDVETWLGGRKWEGALVDTPQPGLMSMNPTRVASGLYNDLPASSPAITEAEASYLPHALSALGSTAPPQCWQGDEFKGRVAYIKATLDKIIPIEGQQRMLDRSGAAWLVKEQESSHLPWIGSPEKTANALDEVAEEFLKLTAK